MSQISLQKRSKRLVKKLVLLVVGLILINMLAYRFYTQADLTTDKRYTTTEATKGLLKSINDPIRITVFLTGKDMPAAFQRLSKSTIDVLTNFRAISNNKLDITVSDPNSEDSTIFQTIVQYRMEGIPVTIDAGKKGTQQIMVFPWVLVENLSSGAAMPVFVQETNAPQLSRTVLNKSEVLLEYNIANAINTVTKKEIAKVVFLTGNEEDLGYNYLSAIGNLASLYQVDTFNLKMAAAIPSDVDVAILNSPYQAFSEQEKYKLDQYIMNGGSVLMMLNQATGSLDSFRNGGQYNVLPIDLNLSDLLFHYGVRVNTNLLADGAEHEMIPLSKSGRMEESMLYPWQYFPVLKASDKHPITKNLDGILGRFVSSIDLAEQDNGVTKTVLLTTSKYTKTISLPTPLILTDAITPINTGTYKEQHKPVAVLLEGNFSSFYAKRKPEEVQKLINTTQVPDKTSSENKGKLIVIGDGDIIYNDMTAQGPLELGQYKFGGYRYDNKSFLMNAIEYLSNEQHLLEARNKSFTNRILDPQRVQKERFKWQVINIAIPSILILIIGIIWAFIRKRKYG